MPKGKLNLTMLENKYHKYEDRPQDYIIDLIKQQKQWSQFDPNSIQEFFTSMNNLYFDEEDGVAYHNLTHGFDVAVILDNFLIDFHMLEYLEVNPFQRICMLIAAYAHDNGHQGFNNYYYNSNNLELALLYAYNSPLENMHASNLMRQIVKYSLPISMEYRKMMVSMILGTDMAHHFECIQELSANMERYKDKDIKKKDRQFLFNVLIHASDLNNQAKQIDLHLVWNQKINIQFVNQRKKQEEFGTVSMLKPKKNGQGQFNFLTKLVFPLYDQLVILNPSFMPLKQVMEENKGYWKAIMQKQQ